ncbi:hypothetical protein ACGFIK_02270 [Micromonospora sp. NPDC048871]|uniref:hypothetical protein n=1 Tax=unclassified Micromonospora TaxID=2617518 RepID=UPI002E123535|nr:hypothetical protein OIE53_16060 [Micromonospora sp. NBC_01739]
MERRLTDEEMSTLKTGAFGAVFLVSDADPGVLALFRESFAASAAIVNASGVVETALSSGPLPKLPRRSAAEIEGVVLPALREAVRILAEKSPEDVAVYRSVVLAAADRTARAHNGISAAEAQVIERIAEALA